MVEGAKYLLQLKKEQVGSFFASYYCLISMPSGAGEAENRELSAVPALRSLIDLFLIALVLLLSFAGR